MQQTDQLDQRFPDWIIAPVRGRFAALAQVVAAMILSMGLSYLINSHDPLWLKAYFPWVGLVATIAALRYGLVPGMVAVLCMVAGWWLFHGQHDGAAFPVSFFVGVAIQVAVAGYFRNIWAARTRRVDSVNAYLNDRLVSVTNNHYLLQISHDRLEKDLLSRPSTLRHAILQLRTASAVIRPGTTLPNIQELLEFVALNCQIGDASVFPVTDSGFSHRPEAFVGERFELEKDDPLVISCVEKRALSHLREIDAGGSDYLACAPIVTASGRMLGLFVVRRMPFLALNFDNLQLLLVLLRYYADGIEQRPLVDKVHSHVTGSPYDFALELGRMTRLRHVSGIRSSLVALVVPKEAGNDSMFAQVMRQHRALDLSWEIDTEAAVVIVSLLPLTDRQGASDYIFRIENLLNSQFSTTFSQARVAVHSVEVSPDDPGTELKALLGLCNALD